VLYDRTGNFSVAMVVIALFSPMAAAKAILLGHFISLNPGCTF
jgi:hypothetical protein